MGKAIIHVDMDAFYPSVETLDNPELKGKPVIVGGINSRGVVSSASYEARKFGVHSAMPITTALKLCPGGIYLPVRMSRYKEISRQIFHIFYSFTPLVEPLSIDEAFLDVTACGRLLGKPEHIARKIKETVLHNTGLTISAGVASSKFVAKIASDMNKPDGLTVVDPQKEEKFLEPLSIEKMWGVGEITRKFLLDLGIKTIGDLKKISESFLEKKLGNKGLAMRRLAFGIDDRNVTVSHEIKSIGHEDTFLEDIMDVGKAKKELLSLAHRVAGRMRKTGFSGKTITLKVKYMDFRQITRSVTLSAPTDDGIKIYNEALVLMKKTDAGKKPIRLLGISVSNLYCGSAVEQLSLFSENSPLLKIKNLNKALDTLYEKYGKDSIHPGTLIG